MASFFFFNFNLEFNIYLFVCLCQVLVVTCRIFNLHCGMWDLF